MAYENLGKTLTFPANTDLSAAQYKLVVVNSSGNVAVCGDGADAVGVLLNDPAASSRGALVCVGGVSKVMAGGTCTCGSYAASDASGRAVNAASGDYIVGTFVESATVAGTIIEMIVQRQYKI